MAKLTPTRFAASAVKLWHLLNALDVLKGKLRERKLSPCTKCVKSERDRRLISKYFRARNAASAILNSLSVQID